jgi:hypothetical protein
VITDYRRDVRKMITNYKKLAPKIDKMCRYMEGYSLLYMAKKWGNSTQQAEVVRLFKLPKLGLLLQCRCINTECDWANYDKEADQMECTCIENKTLTCNGLYVMAFAENGTIIRDEIT